MANNVATLTAETGDFQVRPDWLPPLDDAPARSVRSYLQQLPESTPAAAEAPLVETDTSPGFAALNQIPVGRGPIAAMDVDADNGLVYVTNPADDSIAILDPAQLAVVARITGAVEPFALAVNDGRAYLSTVDGSHDAVTVIGHSADDTATYPLSMSIRDLAADGDLVYAARTGRSGADVAGVDTATGAVATIDLRTRPGANAEAIAISADGTRVYVVTADHLGGEFVVIDTVSHRVVGGLAFPVALRDVAAGADGMVYVASCQPGGAIDVVDTRSMRVCDSIDIGGSPTQLVVSAAGDRLYVVNGDRVLVICTITREIVDTITVVAEPSCIAESSDGKRLFIADYTGAVTALKVASTTRSPLVGLAGADVIDVAMLELESSARIG